MPVVLLIFIDVGYQSNIAHLEECWVVEQAAVNATTVRPFHMAELEFPRLQLRLVAQVLQAVAVLHLTDTDNRTTHARQDVGTHLCQHRRHIAQLMLIFHLRPLVSAVGQILVVVFPFIVLGIKQIFQIVEAYAVNSIPLCLKRHQSRYKE